jgi:phage shock protein PspC (stress-responsive transcriptional regulator)
LEKHLSRGKLDGATNDAIGGSNMDAKDTPQNGPDEPRPDQPRPEDPTVEQPRTGEGPQAPPPPPGTGAPPSGGTAPRRLMRSRENRVLGGVCGGLGRYFNVDPIFFRIGAIVLLFAGGAGLLAYLAALLLMPSEDGTAVVTPPAEGRGRGLVIAAVVVLALIAWPFLLGGGILAAGLLIPLAFLVGVGVLVWWLVSGEGPSGEPRDIGRRAALGIGVLILCCTIAFFGAWWAAAGPDWVVAALVIAAGVAILAGAFLKPVRWLVLPAVSLALAAGAVSAAGIDLDGGVGERDYRPLSAADLRDRYELGIGELTLDLRDTDLPRGDVFVDLDVGVGEARVLVPEDVCVATTAEVGVGNVRLFGRDNGGIDIDFDESPEADAGTTRLVLDAQVGLGEVRVQDDDDFYFDEHGFDRRLGGSEDLDGRGNAACSGTGESASG